MIGNGIAVIPMDGAIAGSGSAAGGIITPEEFFDKLNRAEDDFDVKAIVLRVNSPGGTVAASEEISAYVKAAEQAGGRLGRRRRRIGRLHGLLAGRQDHRAAWLGGGQHRRHHRDPQRQRVAREARHQVRDHHRGRVQRRRAARSARSRRRRRRSSRPRSTRSTTSSSTSSPRAARCERSEVESLATGWAWNGSQAKELGLVDELGTYEDALKAAAKLGGIKGDYAVVRYDEAELRHDPQHAPGHRKPARKPQRRRQARPGKAGASRSPSRRRSYQTGWSVGMSTAYRDRADLGPALRLAVPHPESRQPRRRRAQRACPRHRGRDRRPDRHGLSRRVQAGSPALCSASSASARWCSSATTTRATSATSTSRSCSARVASSSNSRACASSAWTPASPTSTPGVSAATCTGGSRSGSRSTPTEFKIVAMHHHLVPVPGHRSRAQHRPRRRRPASRARRQRRGPRAVRPQARPQRVAARGHADRQRRHVLHAPPPRQGAAVLQHHRDTRQPQRSHPTARSPTWTPRSSETTADLHQHMCGWRPEGDVPGGASGAEALPSDLSIAEAEA